MGADFFSEGGGAAPLRADGAPGAFRFFPFRGGAAAAAPPPRSATVLGAAAERGRGAISGESPCFLAACLFRLGRASAAAPTAAPSEAAEAPRSGAGMAVRLRRALAPPTVYPLIQT